MKILIGLLIGFAAGVIVTTLLMSDVHSPVPVVPSLAQVTVPVIEVPADVTPATDDEDAALDDLRSRHLQIPVLGVGRSALQQTYNDPRGADRAHHGIDILAPRNTPVLAVEDGVIAKLFASVPGGLTMYQFDPTARYTYYYAHLERYADGLVDGLRVTRGQVLGYVGTSGNAPKDTPHLHFEIGILTEARQWWNAVPVDPYRVLR